MRSITELTRPCAFLLNLTFFGNEALNDRLMDSFLSVVSLCRVIWSAEFPSRLSINPLSVARSSSVILSRVRPHAFKCCDLFHQLFRLPPRQTIPCRWVTVLTWARITVQCCLDYFWHLSSYHSNVTSIKCDLFHQLFRLPPTDNSMSVGDSSDMSQNNSPVLLGLFLAS